MAIEKFREIGMVIAICEEFKIDFKKYPILVETGTYKGDTARICSEKFEKVYTIELSEELYKYCKEKYKNIKNIEFHQGNSPEKLKEIINKIKEKYILFLDAHGSGGDTTFFNKYGRYGTPILEELEAVKTNPPDIIIIDDYKDYQNIKAEDFIKNNLGKYSSFSFPQIANWELVFIKEE